MEGVALVILARVCLPGILRSLNRRLMARIEVIAYQDDAAPHVEQLALATSTPSYCDAVDTSHLQEKYNSSISTVLIYQQTNGTGHQATADFKASTNPNRAD